ncbi:MAG TPA: hypothetical protein VF837_02430 [Patescibacteria group bacterium]
MPFYQSPLFVGAVMTSPLWLMVIGTLMRVYLGGQNSYLGRTGMALQFLAELTVILDLLLAASGPGLWPALFNSLWALVWLLITIAVVYTVYSGPDKSNDEFGLGNFWGILVLVTVCGVILLAAGWALWHLILLLADVFKGIVVLG